MEQDRYDVQYRSELEDSLAEAILAGEIKRGQEVVAGVSKKEIKFFVKSRRRTK